MIDLTKFEGYPVTTKVWGKEICLVNNPFYCAKIMVAEPFYQCSLHSHRQKHETFFVLEGMLGIEWGSSPSTLYTNFKGPGDPLVLPPGTWHRFWAVDTPAIFLEVSTHHEDSDVDRAAPSGPIGHF